MDLCRRESQKELWQSNVGHQNVRQPTLTHGAEAQSHGLCLCKQEEDVQIVKPSLNETERKVMAGKREC